MSRSKQKEEEIIMTSEDNSVGGEDGQDLLQEKFRKLDANSLTNGRENPNSQPPRGLRRVAQTKLASGT